MGQLAGMTTGAVVGGIIGNKVIGGKQGAIVGAVLGAVIGGMVGYEIGRSLSEQDRKVVHQRFALGLSQGKTGQVHNWTNADKSAAVNYTPSEQTTRVNKTRVIHTSAVEPVASFEMIGSSYKVSKAVAMRSAAKPNGTVVSKLAAGEQVYVLGLVTGAPWYVIGRNDVVIGYAPVSSLAPVSDPNSLQATLIANVPESPSSVPDASMALSEIAIATPCRGMKYDIQTNGSKAEEGTFEGCKQLDGNWVLQPDKKSAG